MVEAKPQAIQEKLDWRLELGRLDSMLSDLKLQYEQYFMGLMPLAPDKLHNEVKFLIRKLIKAPFKNSANNYRLRAIRSRYASYESYWKRVLREREEGSYTKDVFKANMRERFALEDSKAGSLAGAAESGMRSLFNSYREALEKHSGRKQQLDFEKFKRSLMERAKDFKAKNPGKKLSFKVLLKNNKVTLQAQVKE